jgi:mono/diheme cytochrome c family protein
VLLALSSSQKLVLGLAAAAFVTFALVSSMLIPRSRPDYPGKHLGWFMAAAVLFTVGMLSAVVFVAGETGAEEAAASETHTGPTTTVPTTTQTGTTSSTTSSVPKGDAAAGKALFTSQGCASCHTFTPAGSKGTVGPNLDNLASDAQKANQGSVEEYAFASIHDPNGYVVPGFQPGIMPDFGKTLKTQQIADLVAFLTQQG